MTNLTRRQWFEKYAADCRRMQFELGEMLVNIEAQGKHKTIERELANAITTLQAARVAFTRAKI